jgi:hypothetical protein
MTIEYVKVDNSLFVEEGTIGGCRQDKCEEAVGESEYGSWVGIYKNMMA